MGFGHTNAEKNRFCNIDLDLLFQYDSWKSFLKCLTVQSLGNIEVNDVDINYKTKPGVIVDDNVYTKTQNCFDFLPTRAQLDLMGWDDGKDFFAHS